MSQNNFIETATPPDEFDDSDHEYVLVSDEFTGRVPLSTQTAGGTAQAISNPEPTPKTLPSDGTTQLGAETGVTPSSGALSVTGQTPAVIETPATPTAIKDAAMLEQLSTASCSNHLPCSTSKTFYCSWIFVLLCATCARLVERGCLFYEQLGDVLLSAMLYILGVLLIPLIGQRRHALVARAKLKARDLWVKPLTWARLRPIQSIRTAE